jgi:amidase
MDANVAAGPTGSGVLDGLVFAVKDVFDIAGHVSSAGNPDWLSTHAPAVKHAKAIRLLLAEGASLRGATHTDELMYSLNGINAHYGTPDNPAAPDRIPGGSSSGSAVAVASSSVDFALGTDTGGSVRIPSSFCGIYGFRPTHGRVSADGVIPLAPSFDTVGWMSRSAGLLRLVGSVLLGGPSSARAGFRSMLYPEDIWGLAYPETRELLKPAVRKVTEMLGSVRTMVLATEAGSITDWMNAFRHIQALEIWQTHGEWIRKMQPRFGPGIAERFQWASSLVASEHADAFLLRLQVRERMNQLLGHDGIMVIPTAPGFAPLLDMPLEELEIFRGRMLSINCITGLSGLPQVHLPVKAAADADASDTPPIGISLIAGSGQDERLLAFAETIAGVLESGA